MIRGRRKNIREKVLERVAEIPHPALDTPCWVWQGADSGKGRGGGYPRMCLDGQTVVVHKCRNRMCVNHKHLEMVTHLQNQRRRAQAARA